MCLALSESFIKFFALTLSCLNSTDDSADRIYMVLSVQSPHLGVDLTLLLRSTDRRSICRFWLILLFKLLFTLELYVADKPHELIFCGLSVFLVVYFHLLTSLSICFLLLLLFLLVSKHLLVQRIVRIFGDYAEYDRQQVTDEPDEDVYGIP